jgi:DNA segregation ATPase FtsK/SpoIIIE, S-DNA-T family
VIARLKPTTPEETARIPKKLPYVVMIIDELADLMMTNGKEVESHITRLAQKSRAVGIHLIVATQRPSVDVITGLIKANMPARISFRVASRVDSRTILDQKGADLLLGQGDMMFLIPGTSKMVRAQGTYISDEEVHRVTGFLRGRGDPEFARELVQLRGGEDASDGGRDELFDQAVETVLDSRRGSVSLLQRRLAIGYSRASRLIDQMAEAGIVGEYRGSAARDVMMTLEDWRTLKALREEYR